MTAVISQSLFLEHQVGHFTFETLDHFFGESKPAFSLGHRVWRIAHRRGLQVSLRRKQGRVNQHQSRKAGRQHGSRMDHGVCAHAVTYANGRLQSQKANRSGHVCTEVLPAGEVCKIAATMSTKL